MFLNWYNIFSTSVLGISVRGLSSLLQDFLLLSIFCCFFMLRVPYFYGMVGFITFLVTFIFPMFCALFFNRSLSDVSLFLSGFVPSGTPLWIVPFVCIAETISYVVRPLVLLLRPFVNLSLGAVAMFSVSLLSFSSSWVFSLLLIIFFYEIFVALVHWFIVCNILSFTVDH